MKTRPLRKVRIPLGRCVTGKLMFDHGTAQGALADARKSGNRRRRECRIYKCPECDTWHLTSQETYEGDAR